MVRWLYVLMLTAACLSVQLASAQEGDARVERQARGLEQRLLAPCCYQQTLDTHHSELTDELRRELRLRLTRGEAAVSIEQDLVRRYGERIVAVPASSPLETFALVVVVLVLVAGAAVWLRARRWVRKQGEPSSPSQDEAANLAGDAAYDVALDRALASLDQDAEARP
jgi:cytochrome c-type biogenesis protein CcmH